MTLQRYVADELTHLTGRNKEPEDAYAALISILTSGTLRHSGEAIPHGQATPLEGAFRWNPDRDLIGHDMFNANMVCFCDIPIADMALHARKYSQFGLAFPRRFLVEKGANPVFYVASNARANPWTGGSLADVFTDEMRRAHDFFQAVQDVNAPAAGATSEFTAEEADRDISQLSRRVFGFLMARLFMYLKFFDADLPPDDERNYYMEREWRIIGGVEFSLGDVRRVLLPEKYATRLRKDVPGYHGQVSFLDP